MKKDKKNTLEKRYKKFYDKCLSKAEKMRPNKKKISNVLKKARKIFERLHNIPRCEALTKNICYFCDLLSDYFAGIYQELPLSTIVAVLAGLLYVVSPIDAFPDVIPVLGWIDDAAVLAFVVAAEQGDVEEYLNWKKQQVINDEAPHLELVG